MSVTTLNIQCPFCKAVSGAPCVRANGTVRAAHQQRRRAMRVVAKAPPPKKKEPIAFNETAVANMIEYAAKDFAAMLWHLALKPVATDGSPIETALRLAYNAITIQSLGVNRMVTDWREVKFLDRRKFPNHCLVYICPQAVVGPYRADFLLVARHEYEGSKFERVMAVECDGYEYHDRDKYTIERDKERDRYFASKNILVMRFAGSELHRNAYRCAVSTINPINEAYDEWLNGLGAE